MANYSNLSPYFLTKDTGGYLDIINFRNIPLEVDDIEFEIPEQYSNRPDLLAYDLYGDVRLWWVFAVRNKDIIKDPVFDMSSGVKIRLPKLSTLSAALGF